ncbi:hypothetical protein, partial [Enterobacter asburiae]
AQTEPDAGVGAAAPASLSQIHQPLMWGDLLGHAFIGLSLGSVLLLSIIKKTHPPRPHKKYRIPSSA